MIKISIVTCNQRKSCQQNKFYQSTLKLISNQQMISPSLLLLLLLSHFGCVRLCASPQTAEHQAPPPWGSPGKNTGVGCHFLLLRVKVKLLSRVRLLATPWTEAYQAPLSMGFSRQEYWSGVPLPSPLSSLALRKYITYNMSL